MKYDKYDLVMVGSSFASSFFLYRYLQTAAQNARILVIEKGGYHTHAWQVENRIQSPLKGEKFYHSSQVHHKWVSNIGFGGNSNCWWACVPRMFPNDFKLHSQYGVGYDWPISYEDLEPYYDEAERIMAVSGPDNSALYPGRQPYPLPPHNLNATDQILQKAYPGEYFSQPTARASKTTAQRPQCCASGVCGICPINAKFTILNGMQSVYEDPRVELILEADVTRIDIENNIAKGVEFTKKKGGNQESHVAKCELVGLGANALFNPYILLNSGDENPLLGRGINEQVSFNVMVKLDGLDNYQGSTSITGHGYMFYDGEHRRDHASCLVENSNIPYLRSEQHRWAQTMNLKFIFEDIPEYENHIKIGPDQKIDIHYTGHSSYTQRAIDKAKSKYIEDVLSHLPVEAYEIGDLNATDAHILGTTRMGKDPNASVISERLFHHKWKNVMVLGGGAFPASAAANPTLTICALSLKCAAEL